MSVVSKGDANFALHSTRGHVINLRPMYQVLNFLPSRWMS